MSTLAKRILGEADGDDELRRLAHKAGALPPYTNYRIVLGKLKARRAQFPEYAPSDNLFLTFEGTEKVRENEDDWHWWMWQVVAWPDPDDPNDPQAGGAFALATYYYTNAQPDGPTPPYPTYSRRGNQVYTAMPPEHIYQILDRQIKEFVGRLSKVLKVWRIMPPNLPLESAIKRKRPLGWESK